MSRDPFARPADRILELLRRHGLAYKPGERIGTWLASCPACRAPSWSLLIVEHGCGGDVTLRCRNRCSEADILAALKRDPHDALALDGWRAAGAYRAVAQRALKLAEAVIA